MERHFAWPVTIAAAVHAALLFGFTKVPQLANVAEQTIVCPFVVPLLDEPAAVTINDEVADRTEAPPVIDPPPRAPEPVVEALDTDIVIPVPAPGSVVPNDIRKIADNLLGAKTGRGDSGWNHGPVLPDDLDNPPRTRFQAAPVYPFEAKRQGVRGEVVVEFTVDEEGRVRDPRVVSSSHGMFEEATLRAVAKWQFEAGRRNGRIVRFKMAVPVVFNLND